MIETERPVASTATAESKLEDGTSKQKKKPLPVFFQTFQYPFFVSGVLQCAALGALYAFPLYTAALREHGFSANQVTILGIFSNAGLGLLMYPTFLFYQLLSSKFKAAKADRLLTAFIGTILTASPLLLGIILLKPYSKKTYTLFSMIYLLYGAMTGATFLHVTSVVNFNLNSHPLMRRIAIAQLSISLGLGAVCMTFLYQYALSSFTLTTTYFTLSVLYLVSAGARFKYNVRTKLLISSEEAKEEVSNGGKQAEQVPEEEENTLSATWRDYSSSGIVWLLCLTTGFGLAVCSAFSSAVGNLAFDLGHPEATFYFVLTFLVSQLFGRLISAVIYAHDNNPYIMAIWQLTTMAGVTIIMIKTSMVTAYISTVCIGLGFGGIWAGFPVIAATSFPGNPKTDLMKGLAIVYICLAAFAIAVSQIQDVLLNVSSWAKLNKNVYFTSYLFFFCLTVILCSMSLVLARLITNKQ